MYRDLREQLGGAVDTLAKLRERVDSLKIKLVHHVDQGEGLTQAQLDEVYAEFDRLFPRRVRKASEGLDARL
jgi:hypothetical protein